MAATRVLLVDDELEFTDTLAERMTARGLEVDIAANGPEALKMIKEKSYDVILLDLVMPGMDGIESMKKLLGENPDLQIVLLTGHATLEKGIEAVKMGAQDFIEKPADIKKLMELIEKARANRMLLVEKRHKAKIQYILKSKGW